MNAMHTAQRSAWREPMVWLVAGLIAGLLGDVDWDAPVDSLSGGQRQRLAVARTLLARSQVVVLDEPSAGLDIGQREALTKILGAVAGHAITIVSTHLVEDIIDHAQTITVMNSGRFVFDGSCEDFSDTRSLDAVRRTYLRLVA